MEKIKITPPEGFEVDKEKSTFEEIVFKPLQKPDLSILNDTDWFYIELPSTADCLIHRQEKYYAKGKIVPDLSSPLWYVNITPTGGHAFDYSTHSYLVRPEYINLLRKCTDEEIAYIKQNKPDWFRKTKWEDFGVINGYYSGSTIVMISEATSEASKRLWLTKELSAASEALCQLVRYMDDWNEGWVPDWDDAGSVKTSIVFHKNKIETNPSFTISRPLYFKTQELAESFIKEFKHLLEIAKPLL